GTTETIIGDWIARHRAKRSEIILATKIAGPGLAWVRGGAPITGPAVIAAVDASLARLQTDYIDLYQLHWPNRTTPHFGKHWPGMVDFTGADHERETEGMLEILHALENCVRAGKIRHCGLSDDTAWGAATYLRLARDHGLPPMVSLQNEFSLLQTKDWPHLIEHCVAERVAYLPWSPLAAGAMTGKYAGGARPAGSRWSLLSDPIFRDTPTAHAAIAAYGDVAAKHGLTPAQLALAWVDNVKGVTSTIIGATSLAQLEENLAAFELDWTEDLAADVLAVLKRFPAPF
ncbi:MAG: aldo/keto reductase, partial [Caulobacterales bacterium]|nr:aldo/keto reductase [Caulobacterales bacterium]